MGERQSGAKKPACLPEEIGNLVRLVEALRAMEIRVDSAGELAALLAALRSRKSGSPRGRDRALTPSSSEAGR